MLTALLALAWLAGVAAASWGAPGGWRPAVAAAALTAGAAYWRRPAFALAVAAVCAGLAMLGVARRQAADAPPPPSNVAFLVDRGTVRLEGVVRDDPEERERSRRLRVDARAAAAGGGGWQPATGGVLVRVPLGVVVRAGDRVRLEGTMVAPARLPHFDYRAYLARQGVQAQMDYPRLRVIGHERPPLPARLLRAARRAATAALDRALPHPEADLARGIVVGDRAAIPAAVAESFNRSGTSHLIAISGFNITLVAGMTVGALAWLLGRRRAAVTALAAIALYAAFVGPTPSVARALVMGVLVIGAALLGRPGAPLVALALAAAAMTAQDPRVLNDLGFQLSFAATAGILVLHPPLQAWFRRLLDRAGAGGWTGGLLQAAGEAATVSCVATVATAPVLMYAFGRVSIIAPLANLLVAPLFPLVMLTSGAAALAGALAPALAPWAGTVAYPPLAFTIAVARAAAAVPGAALDLGHRDGWVVLALYLLGGALLLVVGRHRPAPAPTDSPSLHLGGVWAATVAAALLVGGAAAAALLGRSPPDGRLTVVFAEAGGAPLALVIGPGGERVLVDAGPTAAALTRTLDPLLPRDRRLSAVALTRRAPTTMGGLSAAVERYAPGLVAAPAAGERERAAVDGGAAAVATLEPGAVLVLGGRARLEFEAVPGERGRLAVAAVLGKRRIAVTPDARGEAGPARLPAAGPGRIAVTAPGLPVLSYDLRAHGPVRVSTDGATLHLRPARGPVLPAVTRIPPTVPVRYAVRQADRPPPNGLWRRAAAARRRPLCTAPVWSGGRPRRRRASRGGAPWHARTDAGRTSCGPAASHPVCWSLPKARR